MSLPTLLALRYRLVWAHARSRQGRIILFVIGYAIVAFAAVLLMLGGFGAAAAAIKVGRARLVAGVVLGVLSLNGIIAAILLGVGVTPAFSEASLRRYPLSRLDRLLARHLTALLEPFWLVILALAIGLAAGFSMLGVGRLASALPAALLFVVTTYLAACLIMRVGEWLLTRRGGPMVVMALVGTIMLLIPGAPMLVKWVGRHPDMWSSARAALIFTPPVAAAGAMTAAISTFGLAGNLVLASWTGVLAILLALAERLPRHARSASEGPIRWAHPVDRIAAIFGAADAPLAGKILRYYVRSPQVRLNFPVVLPVVAMMAINAGGSPANRFLFILGMAPIVAFFASGALSINLFGFDGQGFSRYFLMPLSAGRLLRTAVLASLIPGALLILIGFVAWWALTPGATARMAVMLLSAGVGGLLFLHALAIWTSILAPRPIPFDLVFGNKLSASANALLVGGIVISFGLVLLLRRLALDAVLAGWWVAVLLFFAALVFFAVTLHTGARVLLARREQMFAELEGS